MHSSPHVVAMAKLMRKRAWLLTGLVLGLGLGLGPVSAQNLLPNAQQTFLGVNGAVLAGGFVFTYIPATTTPKLTWQDSALSVPNTNPIQLDSNGQARIWGQGTYRQIVIDANSNLVWDQITTSPGSLNGTACATGHVVTWASGGTSLGCDPTISVVAGSLDVEMNLEAQLSSVNPLYFPTYSQLAGTRLKLDLTGSVSDSVASFRDGVYVQTTDSDLATYTNQHTDYAGRFAVFGPNSNGIWQNGDKNYVGLRSYCEAASSDVNQPTFLTSCSGISSDAIQYGAGMATNLFIAQQFSAADGSLAQSKLMAAVYGIVNTNFADADATHTSYAVLAGNNGNKAITAIYGASGGGTQASLLQSNNVTVTQNAIVMPHSATANEGSIIDYGKWNGDPVGGTYSTWIRASSRFAWVNGGNFLLGIDPTGLQLGTSSSLPSPVLATTAVGPFIALTATAGTPTGVPTIAAAGAIPCEYDTTAHKMWCYDQPAGAWKFSQFN